MDDSTAFIAAIHTTLLRATYSGTNTLHDKGEMALL